MKPQFLPLLVLFGISAILTSGLDAGDLRERATIKHPESVTAIVFSPDGKLLAVGGRLTNGTLVISDLATGKKRLALQGADSRMAFSPDSSALAVVQGSRAKIYEVGADRPRHVIDANSGKEIFAGHDIQSAAFSPDGKALALATADKDEIGFVGQIKLVDPANGKILRTLQGHREGVDAVAFSPDGKTLASTGRFGDELRLWNIETGRVRVSFPNFGSQMALSRDGKILAATKAGGNGLINVWDVETGKQVGEPVRHLNDRARLCS